MDRRRRSVDGLLLSTWSFLVKDVQGIVAKSKAPLQVSLSALHKALIQRDMDAVRSYEVPNYGILQANDAKAIRQVEFFGKRWLFDSDSSTPEELEFRTVVDFVRTQTQVVRELPDSALINRVLDGASYFAGYILGEYDSEEHKRNCRFGSKAAYGLKREDAYLFNRIRKLSATRSQINRFGAWLTEDVHLRAEMLEVITTSRSLGIEQLVNTTDALSLVVVPKSYKSGRTIVPDTILGGFISGGLGEVVMQRLKVNAGLDIRRKQQEHKRVAQVASRTGHLVTADMSKASDNISWPLLQRVLPPEWFDVIKDDAIGTVVWKNNRISVASPLLMGKGYTFPLQTLVFYSLLMSIANELGVAHKYISVYGDDLIYPDIMHKYVLKVFPMLGLKLNVDKTSADNARGTAFRSSGCFRESCGGDYLDGQDIRPYAPMGHSGSDELGDINRDQNYAALCYTLLNGILSRWSPYDVRSTVRFLLIEAQNCLGEVLVVPNTLAVSAGLRIDEDGLLWLKDIEEHLNVTMPRAVTVRHRKGGYSEVWSFKSISYPTSWKLVEHERLYLWDALRLADNASESQEQEVVPHANDFIVSNLMRVPGYREEKLRCALQQWENEPERLIPRQVKTYVDRYNRYHFDRPKDGPSQVHYKTFGTVVSREETSRNAKVDRRNVPLHLLFERLI